jgi:superoxide dismutase, Fe-Mn family
VTIAVIKITIFLKCCFALATKPQGMQGFYRRIIRIPRALTSQALALSPFTMEVFMSGPFKLASLPWEEKALEPVISSRTISFHYHKHHQTYVDTLNKLVEKTKFADMKLEKIVQATTGSEDEKEKKIFNNAAQVWNHDFYWRSLSPDKTEASGKLASAIARDFGSTSELIAKLAEAGAGQFGSGWAWLISRDGKLSVTKTGNAMTPMAKGVNCLLAVDVWEHAYYLDYQNARAKYLEQLLGKLLNWEYAAENLAAEAHAVRAAAE